VPRRADKADRAILNGASAPLLIGVLILFGLAHEGEAGCRRAYWRLHGIQVNVLSAIRSTLNTGAGLMGVDELTIVVRRPANRRDGLAVIAPRR
jgi:hypothetical protein